MALTGKKSTLGQILESIDFNTAYHAQKKSRSNTLAVSKCHDRGMAIKEEILVSEGIESGRYGEAITTWLTRAQLQCASTEAQERLKHLISQLEAVLESKQKKIKPFAG